MTQQWTDIPIATDPSHAPAGVTGGHYVRVTPTIHGLMTVWTAGPSRSFRVHVPIEDRDPICVTYTNPKTGLREGHLEPFTQQDQESVEESINSGLREAGIPDIPSGYDWYVLAPAHIADGAALNNAMREKNSTTDSLGAARIIDDLYNALVAGS
ncbi:DUF5956 family protein [Nocardia fluminea]|uniref:DUF5956 family protein n=1 Tax=Nocardia fluminea TaxID=134984 RepID=UPI00382BC8AC